MEIMPGFTSLSKPMITEISAIVLTEIFTADVGFLLNNLIKDKACATFQPWGTSEK
jgi:hypothetical protein